MNNVTNKLCKKYAPFMRVHLRCWGGVKKDVFQSIPLLQKLAILKHVIATITFVQNTFMRSILKYVCLQIYFFFICEERIKKSDCEVLLS